MAFFDIFWPSITETDQIPALRCFTLETRNHVDQKALKSQKQQECSDKSFKSFRALPYHRRLKRS